MTGGCGCGGVRFELSEPPVSANYCHCERCQRRTGTAASINAIVKPGSVVVTEGEDLIQAWSPEGGMAKEFCSRCGSALWSRNPATGEVMGVRFGVFDSDPGVRPQWRQFVDFAAPWERIPDDGLPRFGERRTG